MYTENKKIYNVERVFRIIMIIMATIALIIFANLPTIALLIAIMHITYYRKSTDCYTYNQLKRVKQYFIGYGITVFFAIFLVVFQLGLVGSYDVMLSSIIFVIANITFLFFQISYNS